MPEYRRKSFIIEAWQFTRDKINNPMPDWLVKAKNEGYIIYYGGEKPYFIISSREGEMQVSLDDYIIKGVKGELYPCKPDIFELSYEKTSKF